LAGLEHDLIGGVVRCLVPDILHACH
jgi:hypothetical protein